MKGSEGLHAASGVYRCGLGRLLGFSSYRAAPGALTFIRASVPASFDAVVECQQSEKNIGERYKG